MPGIKAYRSEPPRASALIQETGRERGSSASASSGESPRALDAPPPRGLEAGALLRYDYGAPNGPRAWFSSGWWHLDLTGLGQGDPKANLWAHGGPLAKLDEISAKRGQPKVAQTYELTMYGGTLGDSNQVWWSGICDGQAIAGLRFPRPLFDVTLEGTRLSARDIEGLLGIVGTEYSRGFEVEYVGDRGAGPLPPWTFCRAVERMCRGGGGIANVGHDGEIHNRPFTHAQLRIRPRFRVPWRHPLTALRTRLLRSPVVRGELSVEYGDQRRDYSFYVAYEGNKPKLGAYLSEPAPDFLWRLPGLAAAPWPRQLSHNPQVDPELVRLAYERSQPSP